MGRPSPGWAVGSALRGDGSRCPSPGAGVRSTAYARCSRCPLLPPPAPQLSPPSARCRRPFAHRRCIRAPPQGGGVPPGARGAARHRRRHRRRGGGGCAARPPFRCAARSCAATPPPSRSLAPPRAHWSALPRPAARLCHWPTRGPPRRSPRVSALHIARGRAARPRAHHPAPRGAERAAAPGPASAEERRPRGTWERKASGIAARMRGPRAERCVRPCVGHARVCRSSCLWLRRARRGVRANVQRVQGDTAGTSGASARAGLVTAPQLTRVCATRMSACVACVLMYVTHTCHPCVSVCNTYVGACDIFVQSMYYARYAMHVYMHAYMADTCKPCACVP